MEEWLSLDFEITPGVFHQIRNAFDTPEDINDNRLTAPSKRIKNEIPSYRKPTHGMVVATEIGLEKIQAECFHFRNWVAMLEQLAG